MSEDNPPSEKTEDAAEKQAEEAPAVEAKADAEKAEVATAAESSEDARDEEATTDPLLDAKAEAALEAQEPPADLDAAVGDEPVSAEATEDHSEEVPPDPGSPDAASPRMQSIVESLLFAADKALTLKQLGELLGETELARVRAAVAAIELCGEGRGFQLHQLAGGYQYRTNPE